jgi:hypothetical protein
VAGFNISGKIMDNEVYKAPESVLYKTQSINQMEKIDYHLLRSYISGRRMIYFLAIWFAFMVFAVIFLTIAMILEKKAPLVFIAQMAFNSVLFTAVAVGALSAKKWGFWVTLCASVLMLFIFPLGTIIGGFGLRGLYLTKEIYYNPEYSFKKLSHAYLPYR